MFPHSFLLFVLSTIDLFDICKAFYVEILQQYTIYVCPSIVCLSIYLSINLSIQFQYFIGMTVQLQYCKSHYKFTEKGTIIIVRITKLWGEEITINLKIKVK